MSTIVSTAIHEDFLRLTTNRVRFFNHLLNLLISFLSATGYSRQIWVITLGVPMVLTILYHRYDIMLTYPISLFLSYCYHLLASCLQSTIFYNVTAKSSSHPASCEDLMLNWPVTYSAAFFMSWVVNFCCCDSSLCDVILRFHDLFRFFRIWLSDWVVEVLPFLEADNLNHCFVLNFKILMVLAR